MSGDGLICINVWREPGVAGKRELFVSVNESGETWWIGNLDEFTRLFLGSPCEDPEVLIRLPTLLADLHAAVERAEAKSVKRTAPSRARQVAEYFGSIVPAVKAWL